MNPDYPWCATWSTGTTSPPGIFRSPSKPSGNSPPRDTPSSLATTSHGLRADGNHVVEVGDAPAVIAEGIFAPDLLEPCLQAGLNVLPIWLDRPRWLNFARRLVRDLRQHRKSPPVLVRRGLALRRAEPALRSRAIVMGFQPMSMRRASATVAALMG